MIIIDLINLLLFRSEFENKAVAESIRLDFEHNKQLAAQYPKWPEEDLPDDKKKEYADSIHKSTREICGSIFQSMIWVTSITITAFIFAVIIHVVFPSFLRYSGILQIISACLILWGILGRLGWSIQTWKAETLPEKVNEFWFRLVTIIGIFVLMLTLFSGLFKGEQ